MNIKLVSAFLMLLVMDGVHAFAGPENIAAAARVESSSRKSAAFQASHTTDGIIGVDGTGEWACEGVTTDWGYIRFPWVTLSWDKEVSVERIVMFDRPSLAEHVAGGKLLFSDGSVIRVNQIPNNGWGKEIRFPKKNIRWVKFEVTDGTGKDLGLSEFEIYSSADAAGDHVSYVDPYIETNRGRYFFFITGGLPFGMMSAAPLTRNKNQNGGGYNYNESEILGFPQIHDWMISGLEIMPGTADDNTRQGEAGWKSTFSHEDEQVEPGYHRVLLRKHDVWAEQTVTDRTSMYRFTYCKASDARIVINLSGFLANSRMTGATVKRIGEDALEGSFSSVDRYWGGPKDVRIFFVIQFDRPLDSWKATNGMQTDLDFKDISGDSLVLTVGDKLQSGGRLQMKIGISYTSTENARRNLITENPAWDFNTIRINARKTWNQWLGRIDVKGGATEDRIKFYTDLWHVLLGRHKTDDVSGDYPDRTEGIRTGNFTDAVFKVRRLPMGDDGKPRFHMYNSDAFWLTQWNLNILWGLAWPEVMDDITASMLQYADNGSLLPRGPTGGGYSYIMTSCPTSNLVVSTYMKGLMKKSDPKHAFGILKRNHMPGGMLGSPEDVSFYDAKGWWPGNAGITIEAAFQDWGLAQMAHKLGLTKDAEYFGKRSKGWQQCVDSTTGFIFPKDRNGKFTHRDPLKGAGWVEANAWQATWSVSHGIGELMNMMGGKDSFSNRLNHAFEMSAPSDFVYEYNQGYVSYANQPGCSNAHLFSYAGKPWLTQYWVRRVRQQAFGGITPDIGYGGHDEDQGQMGAISALMSIGLFNVLGNQSQTPYYEITSPIFDEITIHLNSAYYAGKSFKILTHGNKPTSPYIQKATLNGKDHMSCWFSHEAFAKGGTLEIWLGSEPNKKWGVKESLLPIR